MCVCVCERVNKPHTVNDWRPLVACSAHASALLDQITGFWFRFRSNPNMYFIVTALQPARRQSLTPPSPNTISWEEYITADNGK